MWELYGKQPGGVAIKSTIGSLKAALVGESRPVYIGRIRYLDWAQASFWPNNVLGMAVRKSQGYRHESEVRLITWAWDLLRWDFGRRPWVFHPGQIKDAIVRVLRKDPIFSDTFEEDLRKAVPSALSAWMRDLQLSQVPRGIPVRVDLACLTHEVVIAPTDPKWVGELLASVIAERYCLAVTVRQSELRAASEAE